VSQRRRGFLALLLGLAKAVLLSQPMFREAISQETVKMPVRGA